jgi:hypothetical protein
MAAFGSYEIYAADMLECPGCGHRIARPATHPIAEHFQPTYGELREKYLQRNRLVRSWRTAREKEEALRGAEA